MILEEDIFPVGKITKTHGLSGELSVEFSADVFEEEGLEYIVLDMDGIWVPFYIEQFRYKTDSTGLIQLDGVNSDEEARSLVGLSIYVSKDFLGSVQDAEIELNYFVGFTILDTNKGFVGQITEIDQTTDNTLFVVGEGEDEILIPVGEEYIIEVNHDKKEILMQLPEGLLEL